MQRASEGATLITNGSPFEKALPPKKTEGVEDEVST